jgi:hypothetical protein
MKSNNSFVSLEEIDATECTGLKARCVRACKKVIADLNSLKTRMIEQFQAGTDAPDHWVRQTVNEAEALAWQTGFPHLFFPDLVEEKVRKLADWQRHQRLVRATFRYEQAA